MYFELFLLLIYIILAFCVGSVFVQESNQRFKLFDLPIAIAMGIVVAGFLWVLAIMCKLPPKVGVVSTMVLLAVFAVWKNRKIVTRLIDTFERKDVPYFCFAFLCFGGLTFIASIKMGQGQYPEVFFNMDSSFRLGHAWNMLNAKTYPPDSIFVLNAKHGYHYGAPAAVAAISGITQLSVHKAMFWIFCPIVLLGTFSLVYRIVTELCGNGFPQKISLLLYAPFVFLASAGYNMVKDPVLFSDKLTSFTGFSNETYNSASYGNGVWDASVLAGFFLLAFAILTSLQTTKSRASICVVALITLIVLYKMDMVIPVYVILFVSMWLNFKEIRLRRLIGLSSLMVVTPFILFELFGYGGKQSEVQMLNIHPVGEMLSNFFRPPSRNWMYLTEIYLILVGTVFICWNSYRSGFGFESRSRFAVSVFVAITMCYVTVIVVDIPKTGEQFLLSIWIGSPLIATVLLGQRNLLRRPLPLLFVVPIIFVALIAQWNKLGHAMISVWLPQFVEESSDNSMIGEALSVIPNVQIDADSDVLFENYVNAYSDLYQEFNQSDSSLSKSAWGRNHFKSYGKDEGRILKDTVVVVTNDFYYLKWEDSQPVIPALFGHQAYSVHQRLFPGPGGYNVDAASKIWLQQERLSMKFSVKNKQFSDETKKIAFQQGWTHFLAKKRDASDSLLIDSNLVPLKKIMENEEYAVFVFD